MSRFARTDPFRLVRAAGLVLLLWGTAGIASAAPVATTLYHVVQDPTAGLAFSLVEDRDADRARAATPSSALATGGEVALASRSGRSRGPIDVQRLSLTAAIADGAVSIELDPSTPATLRPAPRDPASWLFGEIGVLLTVEGVAEPIPIVLSARGRHASAESRLIELSLVAAGLVQGADGLRQDERLREALARLGLLDLEAAGSVGTGALVLGATPVPEPGTSLLLGLGLAGLALCPRTDRMRR